MKLEAHTRTALGKRAGSLRNQGILPGVLYGSSRGAHAVSVSLKDFMKVWKSAGESTLVDLTLDGQTKNVIIHDVALDPVKDMPIHVDFYEARADRALRVHVPLAFTGESEAVKALGGVLVKIIHEVEVEALPKDLPHEISVAIGSLKTFEDVITLGDIITPPRVVVRGEKDAVVAKVVPPRSEEELEALAEQKEVSLDEIAVVEKGKKEEPPAAEEPAQ